LQGQTVRVRQTSSDQLATTTDAVLTVGGVSDAFSVTTRGEVNLPTAAILFPHIDGSVVNRPTMTIRGVAADDSGVISVSVNGVAATTSDNYANWQATISLTPSEDPNEISVEVADIVGNVNANAAGTTILYRYGAQTTCYSSFGLDSANGKAYIQNSTEGIIEFDLENDVRRQIPESVMPFASLRYSSQNEGLYVLDSDTLYEIDVQTGNRFIVSAPGSGGISFMTGASNIELDDANGLLYIFDSSLSAVVSIDLIDGSRAIVSDNSNNGPDFGASSDIAFDDGRLFAVLFIDSDSGYGIFEVNLDTGDRSLISDNNSAGPDFMHILNIAADVSNGILYASNSGGELLAVDVDTGERGTVSAIDLHNQLFGGDMQLDGANDRALISSCRPGVLLEVGLSSGLRSRVLASDRGTGPNLVNPGRMAYDPVRSRIVAVNFKSSFQFGSIVGVNVETGDRQIILDSLASDDFTHLFDVAIDSVYDRILATDDSAVSVIAVDPDTGVYSVLSDSTHGGGTNFTSVAGIEVDGSRALVVDTAMDALFAVDLTNGVRTIISKDGVAGSGVNLDAPLDIAIDAYNRQAYIISQFNDSLFRVNLDTGERTLVSSATIGSGTMMDGPTYITLDLQRNLAVVRPLFAPFNGLMLIDLDTGDREFRDLIGGVVPHFLSGLATDPATGRIYTVNRDLDSIGIYDIDANSQILISR
jgi:hypothetical protein